MVFIGGFSMGLFLASLFLIISRAGMSLMMFQMVEVCCLQLLALSLEDAVYIKETKIRIMKNLKLFSEHQISMAKDQDTRTLKEWKENSIKKLIERYPENYRKTIRYKDWEGAMTHLYENMNKILDK